jgi:tetratricopeptide (TPR) repeat protein
MELAKATRDPLPSGVTPNDRGIIALYQGRHRDGEGHLNEAIANYRADGNRPGEASALCNMSRIQLATGRVADAVRLAGEGVAIYESLGHSLRGANARYALGLALTKSGQTDEALDCLEDALSVFRESRQRLWEGMTIFRMAEVHLWAHRPAQAATMAEQSLSLLRGIGGEWRHANVLTVLGRSLQDIGHSDRARACWHEALALFEQLGAHEADEVRTLLAPTTAA